MEEKTISGAVQSRKKAGHRKGGHKKVGHKKGGSRWKKSAVILLAVTILIGGIWACIQYRAHQRTVQAQLDFLSDENAKKGTLHEGEIQEVEDGSFWVLVNQIPIMREGYRECENPASNHYSARVSLYLKENGKLLGNTTRVDPGRYVETIELNQDLPVGEYPVRAVVELFQDQTPAGSLSVDVTLWVLEPEEDAEGIKKS